MLLSSHISNDPTPQPDSSVQNEMPSSESETTMSHNEGHFFDSSPFENEEEMKNYKNEELKTFFTQLLSYSTEEFMSLGDEEIADFLVNAPL